MTLKFKRNYPLVLMLVSILSILAMTMGTQPIVSYTVNNEALQTAQLAVANYSVSDAVAGLTGIINTQATSTDPQIGTLGGSLNLIQP